ncbi:MAG: hypothetical protein ACI9HK_000672 [Pirellulaceae bacterium]|jgi:hypothetical protein
MNRLLAVLGSVLTFCVLLIPLAAQEVNKPVDFLRDVEPIFAAHCLKCHGRGKSEGGLRLTDLASASQTLESAARAVVPNRLDQSELLRRVSTAKPDERMPPTGPPLTDREVAILKTWIANGAEWPMHWSYGPLVRPRLPNVAAEDQSWVRTPIDAFVLQQLSRKQLRPSVEADKRTLLRRIYFDLVGMPPAAEEMDAFLNDTKSTAYEDVVDRLLASPHYGERWARHWMDVVHYAETHGHDQDRPREHAWPYRDYLIRSLNEDKPYSKFIEEQIAGDSLFPDEPQAIVATGMLATGPWDESSLRDIREDTLDREVARYLDRDDIVTTVMSTFVSTTVHCARCHDHKFDPISQREYYGLQAVFAGTDKANRSFEPDAEVARRRRELAQVLAELPARVESADPTLLAPALTEQVARWETEISSTANKWQTATLLEVRSAEGSELKKLDDGSLLAIGKRPEKDTYTFVVRAAQRRVTGVRVEVLTDESLFKLGPGRQENGNLHLNEFRVWSTSQEEGASDRLLKVKSAVADFDQAGWSVDKAIDGNPATAWGIYPEVGKSHQALFALAEPVAGEQSVTLKLELQQSHGDGHLIGRPRISTTGAADPTLDRDVIAPQIVAIVGVPRESRTVRQQVELAAAFLKQQFAAELAAMPPLQMVYAGTSQFKADGSFRPSATPRTVHVLKRGEVTSPLDEAVPAALHCIPKLPGQLEIETLDDEGQRRAALARWVSDPQNVLTWRSIANRIWHFHFGRGLVDTPNDFGRMGSAPSHPLLLDWIASEMRDGGGSLKQLHRLIVTSSVYRQTSQGNTEFARRDADNRYLWRMNRPRLDAESLRDAMLRISGGMDSTMGGPSVRQFNQSAGVHVTPTVDYVNFDVNQRANYRRSVYRFVFRTVPDPFMEALDCPDASQLAPKRNVSLTALQALAMLNDKLIVRQSEMIAQRANAKAQRSAGNAEGNAAGKDVSIELRVDEIYRLILVRRPTDSERKLVSAYASKHGLANACRFLLNSNEFVFVD